MVHVVQMVFPGGVEDFQDQRPLRLTQFGPKPGIVLSEDLLPDIFAGKRFQLGRLEFRLERLVRPAGQLGQRADRLTVAVMTVAAVPFVVRVVEVLVNLRDHVVVDEITAAAIGEDSLDFGPRLVSQLVELQVRLEAVAGPADESFAVVLFAAAFVRQEVRHPDRDRKANFLLAVQLLDSFPGRRNGILDAEIGELSRPCFLAELVRRHFQRELLGEPAAQRLPVPIVGQEDVQRREVHAADGFVGPPD